MARRWISSARKAILWCPSDGYLQPSDLTMSYVAHARKLGVRFQTNTAVRRVVVQEWPRHGRRNRRRHDRMRNGRQRGRCTRLPHRPRRRAGAADRARASRVLRHRPRRRPASPTLPVVRIPDSTLYLRAEINSLLCGGWERAGLSTDPREFPLDGTPPRIDSDWDVLGLVRRATRARDAGRRANGHPQRVQRLAHVHARWPVHRRRKLARARAS